MPRFSRTTLGRCQIFQSFSSKLRLLVIVPSTRSDCIDLIWITAVLADKLSSASLVVHNLAPLYKKAIYKKLSCCFVHNTIQLPSSCVYIAMLLHVFSFFGWSLGRCCVVWCRPSACRWRWFSVMLPLSVCLSVICNIGGGVVVSTAGRAVLSRGVACSLSVESVMSSSLSCSCVLIGSICGL